MSARFPGAAVVVALIGWTAGCVTHRPSYRGPWIHRSFYEEPRRELPATVVVVPSLAKAWTLHEQGSQSTYEYDPQASVERARRLDALLASTAERAPMRLQPLPDLDADEVATLDAHLGLFRSVAKAAAGAGKHYGTPSFKLREFDYTLGPGLAWLRERSGADAALCVFEVGFDRTGEVFFGLVDLCSGDLLWLEESGYFSAEDDDNSEARMIEQMWNVYPGLDAFAAVREAS